MLSSSCWAVSLLLCSLPPAVQSVSCFSQGSCNFSSESLVSLERSSLVHLFLSCLGLTVYPMFAALTPLVPISGLASLIGSSNTLVYQFYPHPTEAFLCSDSKGIQEHKLMFPEHQFLFVTFYSKIILLLKSFTLVPTFS